jgi:hypothetical protein
MVGWSETNHASNVPHVTAVPVVRNDKLRAVVRLRHRAEEMR